MKLQVVNGNNEKVGDLELNDQVFGEMQVVFCRNVFIYFTQELRERVLAKFGATLCPGGFLCLGSSERIAAGRAQDTFSDFATEARIYRQLQGNHSSE